MSEINIYDMIALKVRKQERELEKLKKELKDYDELEQAYQELKDSKQWWNNRFNAVQRDYEDYKSRIEKAINKVQYIIDIGFDYDGYNDLDNLKILVDELVDLARQTKNILNGDK